MKKISLIMVTLMCILTLFGCAQAATKQTVTVHHEDGTYRGTFSDGGYMQVGIQFKLENDIVKDITFRHLEYKGVDYRKEENDKTIIGLREQHEKLIKYLIDKNINESLVDLYEPGNIVTENVDAFTGATLRAGKMISAIRDGLNRGVYSY